MANIHWSKSARGSRVKYDQQRPTGENRLRRAATEPTQPVSVNGVEIAVYHSFEACEALWQKAGHDCAAFAFQSFTWLSVWQATIGVAQGVAPLIVHLSDCTDRTLMILPLGIYRRRGLRVLQFLGGGISDYHAPIIDRAYAAQVGAAEFAALWASILKRLPSIDVVWFWHMPETIEGARNPMLTLRGANFLENAYAAALPNSFDEFRARQSTDFFKDTRRRQRRLGKEGKVEIALPRNADEAAAWVRIMAAQKSRRWRATGTRDIFIRPEYLAFYEGVTRTWFATGNIHVCCLRVGEKIVATDWGLVYNRRFYSMMAGYEEEWARYSPGRILLENVVEWCIAEPTIDIFDLTVGGETYKRYWSDHSLPIYEYLAAVTVRGLAAVAIDRLKRRLQQSPQLRAARRWLKGMPRANGRPTSSSA